MHPASPATAGLLRGRLRIDGKKESESSVVICANLRLSRHSEAAADPSAVELRLLFASIRVHSRLLFAGWFLCFLSPRVPECDRPVKNEVLRGTIFVQDEVAEAFKLILGFAARLPQAGLASGLDHFK